MLLHDTFLEDDSFRTGISDSSSLCSCGEEKESVEHVLLRCCENEEARTVMIDCVSNIASHNAKWSKKTIKHKHTNLFRQENLRIY